ncbi:hypothetical protein IFM89_005519 [Coptis chinensis]|uniref:Uncharacterized protein n=1 Tax=Coptis chinensis TaxID=261450 RepID=A0A835I931_9MAGN|nr:hypothetical protein IFM89_005519 [Coptis chinensis]
MEIESEDGSKISINTNSKTVFGRNLSDRTVSRRHILFNLQKDKNNKPSVQFEVLGKNPVWVFGNSDGESETIVFRMSEKGEMGIGDGFCVSAKHPILFKLKKIGEGEEKEEGDIDPIKEFGLLSMGHEFDDYPKTKIRAIKDWEWFLEESRVDSETDEDTEGKRSRGKKRASRKKKDKVADDEEWTGESEDEKGVISNLRKGKKLKYTTRSKDFIKSLGDVGTSIKLEPNKIVRGNEYEDNNDEDDTLGGFIVNEEEVEEDYNGDEEEEEEDYVDDDG